MSDHQNGAADRLEAKHDSPNVNNIKESNMENVVDILNEKLAKLGVYRVTEANLPGDRDSYAALMADPYCEVRYTGDVLGIEDFICDELDLVFTHHDIKDHHRSEVDCMYVFAKRTADKLIKYLDGLAVHNPTLFTSDGPDS
jgi:hypothetical protein